MKLSSKIRKAVEQLVRAEEADSFKGCGDPAEYGEIEAYLALAKAKFDALLREVEILEGQPK
jgi:hypothetical protein